MVIIRTLIPMSEDERVNVRNVLLQEAKENIIMLPMFLEVAAVSEDNEIDFIFEGDNEDE